MLEKAWSVGTSGPTRDECLSTAAAPSDGPGK